MLGSEQRLEVTVSKRPTSFSNRLLTRLDDFNDSSCSIGFRVELRGDCGREPLGLSTYHGSFEILRARGGKLLSTDWPMDPCLVGLDMQKV